MGNITIINGPNLNLIGKREPEIYGSTSFEEALLKWQKLYQGTEIHYQQSNIEGELVNYIQEAGFEGKTLQKANSSYNA